MRTRARKCLPQHVTREPAVRKDGGLLFWLVNLASIGRADEQRAVTSSVREIAPFDVESELCCTCWNYASVTQHTRE